ncbi:MAG: OmpA family protein [Myxococcaceae bacterium]|jgi:chemotaxis protein MotB|nr:OmpA family protein [Myxococcaceae bacterium]
MSARTPTVLIGALSLFSCVTQSTYDALATERSALEATLGEKNAALAQAEATLSRRDARIVELEQALADEKDKARELGARIDRLVADLAALTRDKSKLQGSVEQMTTALADLERRRAEAEARVQEFRNLLSRFRALIDAGKLKVRIVDGRMVVVLATDVLFASGSATLSKEGRGAVSEVARVLASIPRRTFQVEGHTDAVPIATAQFPSNWELAAARAITVTRAMVESGLAAARVSAASYADGRPVASNDSAEGKAQNRRIDITIVPDLAALPGFDELNRLDGAAR